MTNVEALKSLYVALGGEETDVANAATSVDVLNAIAEKYDGEGNAVLNPDAIANIAAVADSMGSGGVDPNSLLKVNFVNNTNGYATVRGLNENLKSVDVQLGVVPSNKTGAIYYPKRSESYRKVEGVVAIAMSNYNNGHPQVNFAVSGANGEMIIFTKMEDKSSQGQGTWYSYGIGLSLTEDVDEITITLTLAS